MKPSLPWQELLTGTCILRPPKHMLSTFGTTTFHYVLLSPIPGEEKQSRVREGRVTAERPQILTPDGWKKRFEGFGEETDLYKGVMDSLYGQALRSLEYRFKNELDSTSLQQSSLTEMTDRALQQFENENLPRKTLLQGPDHVWAFSIMKFIIDMSLRSFTSNVRELEERGYFNPEERAASQQRHVLEKLFQEAQIDKTALPRLANALRETGLFKEYEDRFFALVNTLR